MASLKTVQSGTKRERFRLIRAKDFTKIRKDNAKDNYFAFIHTFFENMYYNTFNIYVLEGIMWLYRGKDDLTKEIDEYYHSKGDYSHDDDSWILGEEGKAHDKHSLGYEIAEAENKKYVDHSKHSFSEEVAESDKSRRRKSGTDLGDMLIDSIEKASQKSKGTPSAQNVFTQKSTYNYGYNTSRQRRRRSRGTTPVIALLIMIVFFTAFVIMMVAGLGLSSSIDRPRQPETVEPAVAVSNEYFNINDYDNIRRSYPDYDFSEVDAVADFIDESAIICDLEQTNALSGVYCEIAGESIFWYFDIFYSGEGTDREKIADAVGELGDVIKEHNLSNTEINVYVYNEDDTYLFCMDSEYQHGFLEVFDRLGEI